MMNNPLIDFSGLPRYETITPADVTPAIATLLEQCRTVVARIENNSEAAHWENVITPLEDATESLASC